MGSLKQSHESLYLGQYHTIVEGGSCSSNIVSESCPKLRHVKQRSRASIRGEGFVDERLTSTAQNKGVTLINSIGSR